MTATPHTIKAGLTLPARAEITTRILAEARAAPYAYGVNDCFFMGLRQIDAIQGTAHAEAHAGAYSTLLGAQRELRRRGHTSLVTYYATLLRPIGWGSARIGDLAIIEAGDGEHVGIHGGLGWHSITEDGPRRWDLQRAKQAFGV